MKLTTLVLNSNGEPHFQSEDQINVEGLFEVAKQKKNDAPHQGEEWHRGAISFFGGEVVAAVNTGEHKDVTKAIYELLLVVWTYEEKYQGATPECFRSTDLNFTIATDGVVMVTRIPKEI
jgi:hypothetical protein